MYGKRHGFGQYTYSNGGVYEGQWNEDKVNVEALPAPW